MPLPRLVASYLALILLAAAPARADGDLTVFAAASLRTALDEANAALGLVRPGRAARIGRPQPKAPGGG